MERYGNLKDSFGAKTEFLKAISLPKYRTHAEFNIYEWREVVKLETVDLSTEVYWFLAQSKWNHQNKYFHFIEITMFVISY